MTNRELTPLVDLLKLLAHPARLRILAVLREGEHCVCQLAEVLGMPTSTASEHLTELRRAGLLAERREGRWVYYGLQVSEVLGPVLEALWPRLDGAGQIEADRLASVRTRGIPVEVTCRKAEGKTTEGGVHVR